MIKEDEVFEIPNRLSIIKFKVRSEGTPESMVINLMLKIDDSEFIKYTNNSWDRIFFEDTATAGKGWDSWMLLPSGVRRGKLTTDKKGVDDNNKFFLEDIKIELQGGIEYRGEW